MRILVQFLMALALSGVAAATAGEDYWQKNHCSRAKPEPALVKKGVKGHTFKIVKRRGEALETATIGGERITIIHFGCDGLGWQFRSRLPRAIMDAAPGGVYDEARRLLRTIEPKAREEARLAGALQALDNYLAPPRQQPALAQRLLIPGEAAASVSVTTAGEGDNAWLTVMIYTGPL